MVLPSQLPLGIELVARFRSARKALGLPQKTVAKIMGVGQKQISDYELGISIPQEEMVILLERRLADKRAALGTLEGPAEFIRLGMLPDDAPRLLSDNGFFSYIQGFVSDWGAWKKREDAEKDLCEFFVFGPDRLPLFGEQRDQNLWSANLRKQINYHLFGLVNEFTEDQILDAFLTLRRIEAKAAGDSFGVEQLSRIHVHGIVVSQCGRNEDQKADPVVSFYNALVKKTLSSSARVVVNTLVDIQSNPNWLRAIRLGGDTPLMIGRISLQPKDRAFDLEVIPPITFAARRAENVSLKPDGAKGTGWLFLDKRETGELIKYIDELAAEGENEPPTRGSLA